MSRAPRTDAGSFRARSWFAFSLLGLAAVALTARAVHLQFVQRDFLVHQGEARAVRDVKVEAHRGAILDRNGVPLAISTQMQSVAADPKELATAPERFAELAKKLKRSRADLERRISSSQDQDFIWLVRQLPPEDAGAVMKLGIPGLFLVPEYKRFYPQGEVFGHVLGFTGLDDEGLEAIELAFDPLLAGEDGLKRVIQDRNGRHVDDIENILAVRPGQDLMLSLDSRIQHLAYRELKRAIEENDASSGSIVLLSVESGEVLAMANMPTFNPNNRERRAAAAKAGAMRNRAVTDMLEPGSSFKPFVVAAALESGRFDGGSVIDTGTGRFETGGVLVEDEHAEGPLDMAGVLARSSNVAMAKIARELEPQQLWSTLSRFGFGHGTAIELPGESGGQLANYTNWRWHLIASMSRGYSLQVTPLQLAQAYATLGGMGLARPVSVRRADTQVPGKRALNERNARTLVSLLETVVNDGTGSRAAIPGYRVAGKTGTARKNRTGEGGYYDDRYTAVFAGLAPASKPRIAAVVVIDDPRLKRYYGGEIAAPVFAAVVGGALRLMGVAPDVALEGATDPLTGVATMVNR